MSEKNLQIRISPDSSLLLDSEQEPWVKLEQKLESKLSYYASIRDIYKMWTLAVTGVSARTYKPIGCPVEFIGSDIYVYLGFYAWPSDPALLYNLAASLGTIGPVQIVNLPREFSGFVNNSNAWDLPYYMEDVSVEWETATFNSYGDRIPEPSITITNKRLEFSTEVFGAFRVKGKAIGGYYLLTIVLNKPMTQEEITEEDLRNNIIQQIQDRKIVFSPPPIVKLNSYKIENLESTVTADWLSLDGATQTEELEIEIPQCVKDILEFCPNMYETLVHLCEEVSTRRVYYSTCKEDTIVAIIDGKDHFNFCQDLTP